MFKDEQMCRFCLSGARELLPISAFIDSEKTIACYFTEFMNYPVDIKDSLPRLICVRCLDRLLEVKKFRVQCQESEDFLREKIAKELREEEKSIKSESNQLQDVVIFNTASSSPSEDIIDFEPVEEEDTSGGGDVLEEKQVKVKKEPNSDKEEDCEYRCDCCDEAFKHAKNLRIHTKIFHNLGTSPSSENSENTNENSQSTETYRCEKCNCCFRFQKNYETHMQRHSEAAVKCFKCNKLFETDSEMYKHFGLTHVDGGDNEPINCPICSVTLKSKKNLHCHLEIHSTNRKQYTCEFCDKLFYRKHSLISHVRIHTGERPYACEICHRRFNQRNALATHMTLHTGKTVKCPLCDKTFSRPSFLKIHNREHTDERPYACEMCPKRYRQMTHLRAHQLTHFDAKPFECEVCGKRFSQKSTLQQHLYTHTGRPFACPECPMKFGRPYRLRTHLITAHNIEEDPEKYRQPGTGSLTEKDNVGIEVTYVNSDMVDECRDEIDITNL